MEKYIFKKESSRYRPKNITKESYDSASFGYEFETYEPADVPINRYYFSGSYSDLEYSKVRALRNIINYYFGTHPKYSFENILDKPVGILALSSYHLGSGIQRGSVVLSAYDSSGSLLDRATDPQEDGILSSSSGEIGFVLYREGLFVITSDTPISSSECSIGLTRGNVNSDAYRWHHFAASSSFNISCSQYYTTVSDSAINLTMVYAEKGELNHSNNPTYLQSGSYSATSGSNFFIENKPLASDKYQLSIKNTAKSPFNGAKAPFQKQTFITKIGLYDKNKKLIAVANLANPIRKTENREYLFKLTLDI